MDTNNNINTSVATSLYRPAPASSLQNNLAQYYERTSKFVHEKFKEMVSPPNAPEDMSKKMKAMKNEEKPKMNPLGMGSNLDIYA